MRWLSSAAVLVLQMAAFVLLGGWSRAEGYWGTHITDALNIMRSAQLQSQLPDWAGVVLDKVLDALGDRLAG